MAEYYLALRHLHITLAVVSVAIFTLRGGLMLAGSARVDTAWLRYPSYAVDTLLLTTALILISIIHQYPLANGWLTMKVALLVVYILLGSFALRRGGSRRIRIAALAGALLTVGFLFTVARAHHPLGLLATLLA
jgi:uncharacterized membrane protein SirB2